MEYRPNSGPDTPVSVRPGTRTGGPLHYAQGTGPLGWTAASCIQYLQCTATILWQGLAPRQQTHCRDFKSSGVILHRYGPSHHYCSKRYSFYITHIYIYKYISASYRSGWQNLMFSLWRRVTGLARYRRPLERARRMVLELCLYPLYSARGRATH